IDEDYERALREFDRAAQLSPNNADVRVFIASIKRRQSHWQESLDTFEAAQKIDPQNPNIARNLLFTNTAMRRWPEASRVAERFRAMAPASLVAKTQSGYVDFWWKGSTALLKSLVSEISTDPEDAIREGRRAVELKPESKDAFDGAIMNSYLALIYARVGEKELAFPLIERLLKTPGAVDSVDYSITVNDLKYRWEWDPIRKDPRF